MDLRTSISLRDSLNKHTKKWAIFGLVFILMISVVGFLILSKKLSDNKTESLINSVARSFRPQILNSDIRDVQNQMSRVLNLGDSEYVIIRDQHYKPIYLPDSKDYTSNCTEQKVACGGFSRFSTMIWPIYYDEDHQEGLFGYVELRLKNQYHYEILLVLLVLIGSVYGTLFYTLKSNNIKVTNEIEEAINSWSNYIRNNPSKKEVLASAPFKEFENISVSISSLHTQIEKLKKLAAKDARFKAQLTLVKEIGHDLKTPTSQLAKFFAVHISKLKKSSAVDLDMVSEIQRSITKIGDLVRQVESVSPSSKQLYLKENISIQNETEEYVNDLKKSLSLSNRAEQVSILSNIKSQFLVNFPKPQFYRIIDNLVRNSLDAVDPQTGLISISISEDSNYSFLTIKDNGCGIPKQNIEAIFDMEFTTKPARGTGLGLSIVKRICEEHNAEISVVSEENKFSEFRIKFHNSGLTQEHSSEAFL